MDGIHDMGGMHGFGVVEVEPDEPVFHEDWEGRVFGLSIASGAFRRRHIENLDPAFYLEATYYERWLLALEHSLVERGSVRADEVTARTRTAALDPTSDVDSPQNPDRVRHVVAALTTAREHEGHRAAGTESRFRVGDKARVRRMAPAGHTRCPRYVRGVVGTVHADLGPHSLPDRYGNDLPPVDEPCYTIRFDMTDLWGPDSEPGSLFIDLWESYLDVD
jgi:nitrile hydratase